MNKLLVFGIVLVALLAGVGTVSANLVANGGFEDPNPISDPSFISIPAGGSLPGWNVEKGVDQIRGLWTPFEGAQSLDLSAETPGAISQPITTTIGTDYSLSFAMAGNANCGPVVKKVEVYWDDVPVNTFTFDTTGKNNTNMGWVTHTLTALPASKTSTIIRFEDESFGLGDDTRCGVALDAVDVEPPAIPTPEFPSMALPAAFIVGLLGAVLFIQRTKEN